ncbi:MAG TPA: ABC transporter ATP-binding protein, partial [Streptosporangiaceae bacterium]|nr:ABC transporter ATP-binding protein [Streptosporangiaceae bacterium]
RGGYALIIGPTGSGKTTLLEAIAGHAPLAAGRVFLHDQDVTEWPPERRGLGIVYQQYCLFPHLTVGANIAYGLARHASSAGERRARVKDLADRLSIAPLLDRTVTHLSGGEQQRVALARALAPRPSILLLDEPFAAVDPATRRGLRRELRALHEQEGITTLQVTHDFDDALRLGDRVAVLSQGRIVQAGPPEEVFRYPNSAFVAQFVGAGNVLSGTVERAGPPEGDPPRFPARFRSGNLVLDVVAEREGPAHAIIRPEDILLSREAHPSSARNRLRGRVVRLERLGPVVQVYLDVGRPLVASVTSQSAASLDLRAQEELALTFKAMAVHIV